MGKNAVSHDWLGFWLQDSLKFNISIRKKIMKFIFGMHRNIIVFYKLTNFTNLFLSSNFKNNDKVILNYYF